MENIEISDPLFRAAVTALDEGETATLKQLLQDNSRLAGVRLDKPTEGYFKHPYLLWFIADNPIRRGRLHPNIPTIATVVIEAIRRDAPESLQQQIDYALVVAAFYGRSSMLPLLMTPDIDLNNYPPANGGFHTHATALHQAVWSGSLETVKLLVEAGADTSATDRVYKGTPLGWALYAQTEDEMSDEQKANYARIADYLQQKE